MISIRRNPSALWLILSLFALAIPSVAQESAMEQFMAEHHMGMLTADSIDPNQHDMVITALAMQQLTMTDQPAHPAAPHPKPSAQSAPQPCILQIDTLSGRAELLSIKGLHLADVHFTLVDSTWYMWLSVDPLADKYPGLAPYLYCNGKPIMLIDPNGETWTDVDGNEIQDHSQIRAYIFYNPDDFSSQTMTMYKQLEKKYGQGTVALSNVTTEDDFAQDWAKMGSRQIAEVDINHHGNNQTIILNSESGEYITATGNGKSNLSGTSATNVSALPFPCGDLSKARLNLNTCHSNDSKQHPLKGEKLTLLTSFFRYFPFQSARGTKAGVSYGIMQIPAPQSNLRWGIFLIKDRNEPIWDILKRGY